MRKLTEDEVELVIAMGEKTNGDDFAKDTIQVYNKMLELYEIKHKPCWTLIPDLVKNHKIRDYTFLNKLVLLKDIEEELTNAETHEIPDEMFSIQIIEHLYNALVFWAKSGTYMEEVMDAIIEQVLTEAQYVDEMTSQSDE